MERIPKRKLKASQGDVRLGPENGRGRTQGGKNKALLALWPMRLCLLRSKSGKMAVDAMAL